MFTKKTVYTDSFGQKIEKLPTVQQIIAVLTNTGDEVHLDSADERGYYEGQELEFYITDEGVEMCPSTDRYDALDVLNFPVVDVYGGEIQSDTKHFCWHIIFDSSEDD